MEASEKAQENEFCPDRSAFVASFALHADGLSGSTTKGFRRETLEHREESLHGQKENERDKIGRDHEFEEGG